jgi:hypothetical protein
MVERIKTWFIVNSLAITAIGETIAIIVGITVLVSIGFLGS